MKRFYHICKLNITVDAPFFYKDSVYSAAFEREKCDCADIYYHVFCCAELPDKTKSDDGLVYLSFPMGTDEGSVLIFDPEDCRDIRIYIIERNAHILMDDRFLFDTLKLTDIMLFHNVLTLHSSLIDTGRGAIHFCAPSGVGKSTQARLWSEHRGARIINGDKSALIFTNDGVLSASLPFCGTSGICLDEYIKTKAVVFLSQGNENEIAKMTLGDIFTAMSMNVVADSSYDVFASAVTDLILKAIRTTEIFSLSCLPDLGAVETLENALYSETEVRE